MHVVVYDDTIPKSYPGIWSYRGYTHKCVNMCSRSMWDVRRACVSSK